MSENALLLCEGLQSPSLDAGRWHWTPFSRALFILRVAALKRSSAERARALEMLVSKQGARASSRLWPRECSRARCK